MLSYASSSSLNGHDKPDKPLIVKCALTGNSRSKKVTFESARNCSIEILRQRVTSPFHPLVMLSLFLTDELFVYLGCRLSRHSHSHPSLLF